METGGKVVLKSLTISVGRISNFGAGISNTGELTVLGCTFSGNVAWGCSVSFFLESSACLASWKD